MVDIYSTQSDHSVEQLSCISSKNYTFVYVYVPIMKEPVIEFSKLRSFVLEAA